MTKEVKFKRALEYLIEEVEACTFVASSDGHRYTSYREDYELGNLDRALIHAKAALNKRP